MKYLIILFAFLLPYTLTKAQTGSTNATGQKKAANKQERKRLQRGTGQYHGSRDTTPGSPMGTGGAGGDMSGSPAASAIETDDQASKAQGDSNNTANVDTTNVSNADGINATNKKTKSSRKKGKTY